MATIETMLISLIPIILGIFLMYDCRKSKIIVILIAIILLILFIYGFGPDNVRHYIDSHLYNSFYIYESDWEQAKSVKPAVLPPNLMVNYDQ